MRGQFNTTGSGCKHDGFGGIIEQGAEESSGFVGKAGRRDHCRIATRGQRNRRSRDGIAEGIPRRNGHYNRAGAIRKGLARVSHHR